MKNSGQVVVRDPVHGDIRLTGEEKALLDTWEVQRLRGIRQLGTAHLVYPGAVHTRFDHSLGTLHMAHRLCRAIDEAARARPSELAGLGPAEERVIRLAALVHDVTHIPFGHNIEDQSGLLERHDSPERIRARLEGGEAGEVLAEAGALEQVLSILGAGEEPVPQAWRDVLSDTISADILDYLARDAWFTGLFLRYDPRVLALFRVDRASGRMFVDVSKGGMLREDALSEVIRVLEARYYFSERVYYHHAKITAGALVTRAVEEALDGGALKIQDLFEHTDESLLSALEGCGLERAARFARLYRRRRLPKRAAVYPRYANRDLQEELLERFFKPGGRSERRAFEREVEKALEKETGTRTDVILYCPRREMQLKESSIHVRVPGAGVPAPLSTFWERIPRIRDLEDSYRNLWKLYLLCSSPDVKILRRAARIAESLLPGLKNTYQPGG